MQNNLNQLLASLSIPATAAAALAIIFSFLPSDNKTDPRNDAKPSPNVNANIDPWLPQHEGVVAFPTNLWEDPFRHLNDAKKALPNPSPLSADTEVSKSHYLRIFTKLLSSEHDRLLILPVILVGDNGERDVAYRTKDRHAVEYALTIEGFQQEFPDRMSFATTTVRLTRAQVPIEVQLPIPIKLYKHTSKEGAEVKKNGTGQLRRSVDQPRMAGGRTARRDPTNRGERGPGRKGTSGRRGSGFGHRTKLFRRPSKNCQPC